MRKLFLISTALLILSACTKDSLKQNTFLNIDNLTTQTFLVTLDKDTILKTAEGLEISIEAGSIDGGDQKQVALEIKTALNFKNAVKAGLTTKAGNELLSTAGMFYIGTAEGSNATIKKPLAVSVPSTIYDKNMQLYNGVATGKGIDWTEAAPIPIPETETPLMRGEKLFNENCKACHSVKDVVIGPALAHISKLRNLDWLYKFTLHSQEVIKYSEMTTGGFVFKNRTKDYATLDADTGVTYIDDFYQKYSLCLFNEYNEVVMPDQNLSKEDVQDIYAYIENESNRLRLPMPEDKLFDCTLSCFRFEKAKKELENKRKALIKDNGSAVNRIESSRQNVSVGNTSSTSNALAVQNNVKNVDEVTRQYNYSTYYRINVTSFGWYNVDILLKGLPGINPSNLIVRMQGVYISNLSVYLVLPSHKAFLEGGTLKDQENEYGFYESNGNIPLPQGREGYVFATSENNKKLYFAMEKFIIRQKQTITLQPTEITKEEFDKAIEEIDADGLKINASYSKNYDQVVKVDSELDSIEKLKPEGCNCDCSIMYDTRGQYMKPYTN